MPDGEHINVNLEKAIMSILICKRAWDKYGEKSFSFYVVEEVAKSELKSSEIFWIEKLDTFNSGYNLTAGGEGQYGRHLTDAQKKTSIRDKHRRKKSELRIEKVCGNKKEDVRCDEKTAWKNVGKASHGNFKR